MGKAKFYSIQCDIEDAGGYQIFGVEASSIDDAYEEFRNGNYIVLEHEVDVTALNTERGMVGVHEIPESEYVEYESDQSSELCSLQERIKELESEWVSGDSMKLLQGLLERAENRFRFFDSLWLSGREVSLCIDHSAIQALQDDIADIKSLMRDKQ